MSGLVDDRSECNGKQCARVSIPQVLVNQVQRRRFD
jgi:hypothetical protein